MNVPLLFSCVCFFSLTSLLLGQSIPATYEEDPFRQLEEILPTPTSQRAASGAPGAEYWQQRADYRIRIELDEDKHRLTGTETITYHNRSPLPLNYVWMQLDQNRFEPGSDNHWTELAPSIDEFPYGQLESLLARETFEGGYEITRVVDADGEPLPHQMVKTMMRIDFDEPIQPGDERVFTVDWNYNIVNSQNMRARSGYELFEKDGNAIYEIAQWFPRMVAYTDVDGWHNKQFLGRGEFTLEFGDYEVEIVVPDDHIVASTGALQNADEVLEDPWKERLKEAETADTPQFIVTPEEAKENEKERGSGKKSWIFKAENVRDFAWASSRKFIWDAKLHESHGKKVWAMSYYPNEGEPLWSRYSTHSIMHTLDVYSRFSFPYPYPVAISVNGPVYGMEYPMITFNGPRPEEDGTYSERTKYGLISVIIHEVGHFYFPMIVNSDERQWTWMDEGLNTFLQFVAEQEWEEDYPARRGRPRDIVDYMASTDQVPIMTNSESIPQFGNNAYSKPATALNVLRETIMGRDLFDFAFKEYAKRWMFKRPMPADFFRTMEDASGVDLDWFWRGWFYTSLHVDQGISGLKLYHLDSLDPDVEKEKQKVEREKEPEDVIDQRNAELPKRVDEFPELRDFYNEFDPLDVTPGDRDSFAKALEELEDEEKALLKTQRFFYVIDFENVGGLVMPLILQIHYESGREELMRIPVEIWRMDSQQASKLLLATEKIDRIVLDPFLETADTNLENNHWPPRPVESRFRLFKEKKEQNPMQKERDALKKAEEERKAEAEKAEAEKSEAEKPTEKEET